MRVLQIVPEPGQEVCDFLRLGSTVEGLFLPKLCNPIDEARCLRAREHRRMGCVPEVCGND